MASEPCRAVAGRASHGPPSPRPARPVAALRPVLAVAPAPASDWDEGHTASAPKRTRTQPTYNGPVSSCYLHPFSVAISVIEHECLLVPSDFFFNLETNLRKFPPNRIACGLGPLGLQLRATCLTTVAGCNRGRHRGGVDMMGCKLFASVSQPCCGRGSE